MIGNLDADKLEEVDLALHRSLGLEHVIYVRIRAWRSSAVLPPGPEKTG